MAPSVDAEKAIAAKRRHMLEVAHAQMLADSAKAAKAKACGALTSVSSQVVQSAASHQAVELSLVNNGDDAMEIDEEDSLTTLLERPIGGG